MCPVKIIIKSANVNPDAKSLVGMFLTIGEHARLLDYIDELKWAAEHEQA